MSLDLVQIEACCAETERELLRVGGERCKALTDNSQLSAVLFLVLRCFSLFRSMLHLLNLNKLDAFDSVRRSFLETWLLALELRLVDSATRAAKWLARQGDSWSADIKRLEEYSKSREPKAPLLGRYYGELSELAHPTRVAAENSVALTATRYAINTEAEAIRGARSEFEKELPELLYRLLWLVLDEDKTLIPLHVNENATPTAVQFAEQHPHL